MKRNVREWSERYIPSEIIGAASAVLSAFAANSLADNLVATVVAGTWGENLGYYGSILIRDVLAVKKKEGRVKTTRFIKVIRNLVLEFGLAEALDSFLIRPSAMYLFTSLLHDLPLGILSGKLTADIIFYIPTIISYELRKKHLKE